MGKGLILLIVLYGAVIFFTLSGVDIIKEGNLKVGVFASGLGFWWIWKAYNPNNKFAGTTGALVGVLVFVVVAGISSGAVRRFGKSNNVEDLRGSIYAGILKSCVNEIKPKAGKELSDNRLNSYCACTANFIAFGLTPDELLLIGANLKKIPPSISKKITQSNETCKKKVVIEKELIQPPQF